MSSRTPTSTAWFCHECGHETVVLMVPDPACAECNSAFVEQIEGSNDDPRDFAQEGPDDLNVAYLELIERLMGGMPERRPPRTSPHIFGQGGSTETVTFGRGPHTFGDAPTMNDFLRRGPVAGEGEPVNGSMLTQYMMSLLGMGGGLNEAFARGFGADPTSGRRGDYAMTQHDLDEIITRLMETSNPHRPVPATDEIMKNLPREVLEIRSPTLSKDCAVCKEQFALETEDPDEQIVATLPCQHQFHEPCITPWLKTSGTCPVCRHQLVPQPEHHSTPANDAERPVPARTAFPNILQSILGGGGQHPNSLSGASARSPPSRSNSSGGSGGSGPSSSHQHLPGAWDDLD